MLLKHFTVCVDWIPEVSRQGFEMRRTLEMRGKFEIQSLSVVPVVEADVQPNDGGPTGVKAIGETRQSPAALSALRVWQIP